MGKKIPGGYILKARSIQKSAIALCSPCVREVWDFLLRRANHKAAKWNGIVIQRGQLVVSHKDIQEGLQWRIGFRKMVYSEDATKKAMKALRSLSMIAQTKARNYVLTTICNYDYYQDKNNYEGTKEGTSESTNESSLPTPYEHEQYNNTTISNENNDNNPLPLFPDEILKTKDKEIQLPFLSERFKEKWELWLTYRKEKKKKDYVPTGLQMVLTELKNMALSKEENAIKLIEYAMSHNWDGFYQPKEDMFSQNGQTTPTNQQQEPDWKNLHKQQHG